MATGAYEGVAELRLADALAAQARLADGRAGGAQRAPEAAVAGLVRTLERAAELFAQARTPAIGRAFPERGRSRARAARPVGTPGPGGLRGRARAQTREHGFQARAAGEWARLRRLQADLEAETGHACFLGLSLAATLRQCIRLGNGRAAARVRADFRVPDRRFWHLKARPPRRVRPARAPRARAPAPTPARRARCARWRPSATGTAWRRSRASASRRSASTRSSRRRARTARRTPSPRGAPGAARRAARPPVPPARLGRPPRAARRFIARLPDGKHKAEEYAAARMFQEAAECAARARDSDMLSKLQDTLGTTSPLGLAVAQIKERLQAGAR